MKTKSPIGPKGTRHRSLVKSTYRFIRCEGRSVATTHVVAHSMRFFRPYFLLNTEDSELDAQWLQAVESLATE